MENYIGKLLDDRYEILEIIGSGGMAVVYKALCHRLNRLVAIKILKKDFGQNAELHRRFRTESQAVAMLSHPNIVSVYDVSSSETMDYIVMELIDGITLKQYMQKKGVLTWREALHFTIQIAAALEHAHSRGIIHRDIKPHNIMVLKDGSIKVADFGIARVVSAQNTLTRETLGSVHYISPEQARGARIDQRTDLYSLGVMMYEMLTGRLPYDGDSAVSIAIQHIGGNCPMPRQIVPEIPEGLEQIVMHAMCVKVDERYESAAAMLVDLEEFRKNQRVVFAYVHTGNTEPLQSVQQQPKRREEKEKPAVRKTTATSTIIIILCMLLAFLGIGYFLYSYILKDIFSVSEEFAAPKLVGKHYTELSDEDYSNFYVVVDRWSHSESVEHGFVISQDPEVGKKIKAGATIRVVVSQGQQENVMPQVVNLNQSAAEQMLNAMDLKLDIDIVKEVSDIYVSGQVLRSEPAYGAPLNEGDTVILYVSSGTQIALVPVPQLLGLDVEEALDQIDEAGLRRGGILYRASEEEKGVVIYQSVEAETLVKESTMITLHVSKGPDESDDPNEEEEQDPEDDPSETDPEEPPITSDPPRPPVNDPTPDSNYELFDQGNPRPDSYHRALIDVPLPVGVGTVTVNILCDGKQYGKSFIVDLSLRTISIAVYGTGTCEFEVQINGRSIDDGPFTVVFSEDT